MLVIRIFIGLLNLLQVPLFCLWHRQELVHTLFRASRSDLNLSQFRVQYRHFLRLIPWRDQTVSIHFRFLWHLPVVETRIGSLRLLRQIILAAFRHLGGDAIIIFLDDHVFIIT